MIIDSLANLITYNNLNTKIKDVVNFISNSNLEKISDEKIIIDGDNLFVLNFNYSTKKEDKCIWEAHRTYLDLHLVIKGNEKIFFNDKTRMKKENDYDVENDYQLFKGMGQSLILNPGNFLIFQPQDVHKTGVGIDKSETVQKMVIKIKI